MTKKNTKIIKITPKKLSVSAASPSKSDLYDVDFYKWTKTQATLLKKKDIDHIDLENIIEEIEALGRADKRSLRSYITNLFSHLLKIDFQPKKRTKSWDDTIANSLLQIQFIVEDSPSFKRLIPHLSEQAYDLARYDASRETGLDLDTFPSECPDEYKKYLKIKK